MSTTATKSIKHPSILGGAMIIAGTAVGAGMFSIPIVTSGVWFVGSILLLIYTWFCMFISGLMILEANMNYPEGVSFHTLVTDLLGKKWSFINGVSITFVLYVLTYAYISAGSSIITGNLTQLASTNDQFSFLTVMTQPVSGLIFALLVAFIVWLSTRAVDRLSTILIGGMVITFVMSAGGMLTEVSPKILFDQQNHEANYLPYAFAALPYLLASFGYHGNVPGLVKYYHKESRSVVKSLLFGTLVALVIYILWQYVIQGNISRDAFKTIIAEGGNIDALLKQMSDTANHKTVIGLLNAFSYMALASSFLGVSLGLFDYLADFFHFNDQRSGRLKSALITFVPPAILGILFPNGFIIAIGFAGLAATIWAVIVPALLARASRQRFPKATYRVPGGLFLIGFVILFGLMNAVAHILSLFELLPVYR